MAAAIAESRRAVRDGMAGFDEWTPEGDPNVACN